MAHDGFNLSLGMTMDEVIALAKNFKLQNNNNVNQKAMDSIFNFAKEDNDGSITNNVELAMLQGFFDILDVSKKDELTVAMPQLNDVEGKDDGYGVVKKEKTNKDWGSHNALDIEKSTESTTYNRTSYMHLIDKPGEGLYIDSLLDENNDGTAESRYVENNNVSYTDNDLDGSFDEMTVEDFDGNKTKYVKKDGEWTEK